MLYTPFAKEICTIAKQAGEIIMGYYDGHIQVQLKEDDSPVTAADVAASEFIVKRLKALSPDIAVVSEEQTEAENAIGKDKTFWVVDPLDGTKSFIKRSGEFTVNIALIEKGKPVGGVVYIPVQKRTYFVGMDGKAYRQSGEQKPERIAVRSCPADGAVVVASMSHRTRETDAYINNLPKVKSVVSAASSLKFCLVAEGVADLYPRFGRTMEWDTGAGQAVVEAAGGVVTHLDGRRFDYGKKGFENPFFLVKGKA